MKNCKKLLAVFMAALMVFSMFTGLNLTSFAWWYDDSTLDVVSLTVEPMVVIQNDTDDGYWTTTYDDNWDEIEYFHYHLNYADFTVTLGDGTVLESEDGYVEYDGYTYWLDADSYQYDNPLVLGTNEVTVYLSDFESTVTVDVVETPVASVEIEQKEFIENADGYWSTRYDENDNEVKYFYYYLEDFNFTVTLKDGTVFESYYGDIDYYDDNCYLMSLFNQNDAPLTVGEHTIPVSILGYETTAEIKIVETPVASVDIEQNVIIENTNGYWSTRYDENDEEVEWFYYYLDDFDFTVTLKDGTVLEVYGDDSVYYNNKWYYINDSYDQYSTPLTIGEHTIPVSILGYETTAEIKIVESPVASVDIEQNVIIENTDGYWSTRYDENDNEVEYFYYYFDDFDFTVTLKDGTVLESEYWGEIEYNGKDYYIENDFSQYSTPLTVGEYTIPVSILGFESTATVEIVETPVANVEVKTIELIKNTEGYWDTRYDENGNEVEYFYYYLPNFDFTVTLKDGTVLEAENGYIEYNGESYDVKKDIDQYETPLKLGKNEFSVSILGFESTATVEIVETPVASVKFEPVKIIENCDGYWDTRYDENGNEVEYFYYYLPNYDFTVTLKDGTVLESENGYVEYNDESYYAKKDIDQYETPLKFGKNEFSVSVLGFESTATVEIVETPVASVKFEPVKIIENCNGYWDTRYDENGNEVEYFYYFQPNFDFAVTLKDGKVLESERGYIEYNDESYYAEVNINQYETPFKLGKNEVSVSVLGFESTATVEIIESPVAKLEIAPATIQQYTRGYWDYYYDDNDNHINEYFYEDFSALKYTLTLKDGTVLTGRCYESYTNSVEYAGLKYPINVFSENNLVVGKNNVDVEILGKKVTATVEIVAADETFNYNEFEDGIVITGVKDRTVKNLTIPTTINNKPVIGIAYLGAYNITEIVVPDSVKFLSDGWLAGCNNVTKVTLGSAVEQIGVDIVEYAPVAQIEVSANNPNFKSVDGVVYSKDGKTLVLYPIEKGNTYNVPAVVADIDVLLLNSIYNDLNIVIAENSPNFVTVDGVTYNADKTEVIFCDNEKTGNYVMPDTVTTITGGAFAGSKIESVSISKNVNEIVYAAFADCKSLKSVTIPNSVKSIGSQSFANCTSLTEITLPDSVTDIGERSFSYCSSLKKVNMGKSVSNIEYAAFYDCSALDTVTLSTALKTIGDYAFSDCESLKTISLPSGLEYIGYSAFEYSGLTSIVIPDSVTTMDSFAFYCCEDLQSVKLSAGLNEISFSTFGGCTALSSITAPDSIERIGYGAFSNTAYVENDANYKDGIMYLGKVLYATNDKLPATVTIADGTVAVADNAFYCNSKISKVVLPEGLKSIGDSAFFGCKKLSDAALPEGLESIGYMAFANTAVKSVKIPDSVTEIVYRTFYGTEITEIDIPDTLVSIDEDTFDETPWYDAQPDGAIYLGSSLYAYKGKMANDSSVSVKDGTLAIAGGAFDSYRNLKSVVLPEGLIEIGNSAFYKTGLESVTIPSSVKTIGEKAFAYSYLESVEIGIGVEYIGNNAFYNCSLLESVIIPPTVKEIGYGAFDMWYDTPLVIYGAKGSAAEEYATDNRIKFVEMQFTSSELVVPENNSNITVEDSVAKLAPEMSVATFIASVENENVQILDKDGKAITTDALIGTGCKIKVLDAAGNVLSEYEAMVKSDVDGNGKITPADARLALRASVNLDSIEGVFETAANYDETDTVSTSDARMILRKAAGLE